MKKINFKLYFKDIVLLVITALFSVGIITFAVIKAPDSNYFGYRVDALKNTLNISFYYFMLLMFLSYRFLNKVNTHKLSEVQSTTINARKFEKGQIFILVAIDMVFTVVFIAYNLIYNLTFGLMSRDYNIYAVLSCILNILIVGILAITIGYFLTKIKKSIVCYALLVIFAFLFSPIFQSVVSDIKLYENIDLSFLSNILNIFTPGLNNMPNFNNGYSLLPYRWILIVFWIFFFSVLSSLFQVKKNKNYIFKTTFKSATAIVLIILYLIPSSTILPDYSPMGSIQYDFFHYIDTSDLEGRENYKQKEEKADFTVSKYDIEMNIASKLNATVSVDISAESGSGKYKFTLYHGYKVKDVIDQNGDKLNFDRDNDYLTVNTKEKVKSISFTYSGYSNKYYSNYQGVCLPGDFAYYPIPGYHIVFNSESQNFNGIYFDNTVKINVKINAPYKVYCNLPQKSYNIFNGTSEGITLVSGFLKEKTVEGITFVYSYLNDDYDRNINNIARELSKIWKSADNPNGYCIYNKKVFCIPNLNQGQNVTFFSDHITTMSSVADEYKSLLEGKSND